VAKLSDEEQAQLDALTTKRDAPDDDGLGGGRSEFVNVTIDLSDEAAVERGLKLGFLKPGDVEGNGEGDGESDEKPPAEKPPKRKGYFEASA